MGVRSPPAPTRTVLTVSAWERESVPAGNHPPREPIRVVGLTRATCTAASGLPPSRRCTSWRCWGLCVWRGGWPCADNSVLDVCTLQSEAATQTASLRWLSGQAREKKRHSGCQPHLGSSGTKSSSSANASLYTHTHNHSPSTFSVLQRRTYPCSPDRPRGLLACDTTHTMLGGWAPCSCRTQRRRIDTRVTGSGAVQSSAQLTGRAAATAATRRTRTAPATAWDHPAPRPQPALCRASGFHHCGVNSRAIETGPFETGPNRTLPCCPQQQQLRPS